MTEANRKVKNNLRIVNHLFFSVYFSIVLFSAEEERGSSWASTLRSFYVSHRYPGAIQGIDDPHGERQVSFLLAWFLVAGIFVLLLVCSQQLKTTRFLFLVEGAVILCGLPAALAYTGNGSLAYLGILLTLSIAWVFLCVYGKWPVPFLVSLSFMGLLFFFSSWLGWVSANTFPLGIYLVWPRLDWIFGNWEGMKLIYPLMGFCSAVIWAFCIKQFAAEGL
jgi:hypothetical protein